MTAAPTAAVRLDDGRQLIIRAIREQDTERIRALHRSLSPRTMRLRFFAFIPELPPAQAARFTHVDHGNREALVAETSDTETSDTEHDAGRIVAVVRYDRVNDSDTAEVALLVRDDYQGHHLGTVMLRELIVLAASHGITRFVAETLPENSRVREVMRAAGLTVTTEYADGLCHVTALLPFGTAR